MSKETCKNSSSSSSPSRLLMACEQSSKHFEKWKLDQEVPLEKATDPYSRRQLLFKAIKHQLDELNIPAT